MPAGRPTIMTPEIVQKLEQAFLLGCTDLEACLAADISKSTLYNYQQDNPEFVERKEALKENPVYLARGIVMKALEEKDLPTAQKVIDRKEGGKLAVTGAEGGPIEVAAVEWTVVDPET